MDTTDQKVHLSQAKWNYHLHFGFPFPKECSKYCLGNLLYLDVTGNNVLLGIPKSRSNKHLHCKKNVKKIAVNNYNVINMF